MKDRFWRDSVLASFTLLLMMSSPCAAQDNQGGTAAGGQNVEPPQPEVVVPPAATQLPEAPANQCQARRLSTKTDRFSQTTTLQTDFKPYPGMTFNLYSWTTASGGQTYGILVATVSPGLRYAQCRTAYFLADGKPVPTTKVVHYSGKLIKPAERQSFLANVPVGRLGFLGLGFNREKSPLFVEIVGVNLDAGAVAQLGSARTIEYKVCNDEATVPLEEVVAVHDLACAVAKQGAGVRQ
jgi:hypothetical protein